MIGLIGKKVILETLKLESGVPPGDGRLAGIDAEVSVKASFGLGQAQSIKDGGGESFVDGTFCIVKPRKGERDLLPEGLLAGVTDKDRNKNMNEDGAAEVNIDKPPRTERMSATERRAVRAGARIVGEGEGDNLQGSSLNRGGHSGSS